MPQRTDIFDLGRLGLSSGEARRIETHVAIEPLQYGGERYTAASGAAAVTLDVARTASSGYSLRLRYEVTLAGPCVRCLTDAHSTLGIDAREVDQPGGGDDLRSPYLDGDELNLRGWARDALALALPAQIVCREDCLGLCPECGENLNMAGPDHRHESATDPRWSKLSELRFE